MEASNIEVKRLTKFKIGNLNHDSLREATAFIKKNPQLFTVMVLTTLILASGDLLEIMPLASSLTHASWFEHFHYAHDILALGLVLVVAQRWSAAMGRTLLWIFFLSHIPYIALTFPSDSGEHLTLVLEMVIGIGGINLIGRLNHAIDKAHQAASLSNYLARHDPLTDLPNRALFHEQAQYAVASSIRTDRNLAIVYVDLDHFKDINDSLGHHIGDLVLKTVAQRLKETVRDSDMVARLGGDEFAIIANDLIKVDNAAYLADRIIERISEPIFADDHEIHISPSIGIAPYASITDGETVHDAMQLLSHADMAMYRAKTNGRKTFEFFDHAMSTEAADRIALLNDLRHAIDKEQLLLYYQPQIDMRTGKIIGAEALIRWQHPERGMVSPISFIPPAETSGMIIPIGKWVLKTACEQNRAWQNAGLPYIKMGVNLSPVQVRRQPIVDIVSNVLAETGLNPEYLDLELTENVLLQDPHYSASALHELRKLGVTLSIDDFGTGYSSLSCLKQFAVDTLKIDRMFVTNISKTSDSGAIAEAVIKLGHSLRIKVLAEGIEKESELKYLRLLGCDLAQGFYYSKPVPAEEFAEQLMKNAGCATKAAGLNVEFY